MSNITKHFSNTAIVPKMPPRLNLQVCYCGNVALYHTELVYPEIASSLFSWAMRCGLLLSLCNVASYDTELVYPEIASLLLCWALQCALWISNLRQYSLLDRGFYSENACESRAGNSEAVKLVILLSSDFFMGSEICKKSSLL